MAGVTDETEKSPVVSRRSSECRTFSEAIEGLSEGTTGSASDTEIQKTGTSYVRRSRRIKLKQARRGLLAEKTR